MRMSGAQSTARHAHKQGAAEGGSVLVSKRGRARGRGTCGPTEELNRDEGYRETHLRSAAE
jgi:hypothetical protein